MGIRVWEHVLPLILLSGSLTNCLVSGSSWNLAGGFLLEKSESQQVLLCLLPAFSEIKKRVVHYKEKNVFASENKNLIRKMEK